MRRSGPMMVAALVLAACSAEAPPFESPSPATQRSSPVATPPTPSTPGRPTPDAALEAAAGLAFVRQVDGVGQVFLVSQGGEIVQLTSLDPASSSGGATSLSWASDGSRLAYAIGIPVGVSVGLVSAEGGDPLILDGAAFPAWSRDGTRLAVGMPFDVIAPGAENDMPVSLVDPETGERREVARGILPDWHPDGRLLVMRTSGASESSGGTPVVVAVDVESGTEEELVRGTTGLVWSADGERVALVTDAPETCPPECHRILVAETENLADGFVLGPGSAPRWSPDGEVISYSTLRDEPVRVVLTELATGEQMDLGPGDASSVAWSETGDRLAYVFYLADGTPAIRIVDRSGQILGELPGQAPAWQPLP